MLMAPTGVASDNIGGRTYHSVLHPPSKGTKQILNRPNIRLKGESKKQLVLDFAGITHVIIDEMSMIGRRSLGYIDELMRQATGNANEKFGGLNIILVGDHGSPTSGKRSLTRIAPPLTPVGCM